MSTRTAVKILIGVLVLLGVVFMLKQCYIAFVSLSYSGAEEYRETIDGPPYWGIPDHSLPQWTPDGNHIVFSHGRNIHTVNSTGSRLWLVDGDSGVDDAAIYPNVSPDGSRIAYFARKHSTGWFPWNKDDDWEIVTSTLNGSDRRRLTKNEGYDTSPVWSPDGSRLAFLSSDKFLNNRGIYTMAADGSDLQPVVKFLDFGNSLGFRVSNKTLPPVFSPDGNHMAFVVENPGEYEKVMYVVEPGGSGLTRLEGNMGLPAWSPDGRRIAFVIGSPSSTVARLYTAETNGSDPREIFEFPKEESSWTDSISWSPDSSAILFGPYVVETDGSSMKRLASPGYRASWSSDGSRIAVYAGSSTEVVLYTVARDGSDGRVLVDKAEDGRLVTANGRPLRLR